MRRFAPLLLACAVMPAWAGADADALLACMRQNVPATVQMQQFELQTTNAKGHAETLGGELYVQRQAAQGAQSEYSRAVLRVIRPEHLNGAAYLVQQTDDYLRDGMYVYLPSLKRVRRITGTFADGSMLGTAFSYYDFKQLSSAFGDLQATSQVPAQIAGRDVTVMAFASVPGVETIYSGVNAWIDQASCLPLKVEFLQDGKPRKRLTADPAALRQSGSSWYLAESTLDDLQEKTRTVLRIDKLSPSPVLPERYFNPNTFYRFE